jgi:hypothetical protein
MVWHALATEIFELPLKKILLSLKDQGFCERSGARFYAAVFDRAVACCPPVALNSSAITARIFS